MMRQPTPGLVPFYEGDLPAGLITVPNACREYRVPATDRPKLGHRRVGPEPRSRQAQI